MPGKKGEGVKQILPECCWFPYDNPGETAHNWDIPKAQRSHKGNTYAEISDTENGKFWLSGYILSG